MSYKNKTHRYIHINIYKYGLYRYTHTNTINQYPAAALPKLIMQTTRSVAKNTNCSDSSSNLKLAAYQYTFLPQLIGVLKPLTSSRLDTKNTAAIDVNSCSALHPSINHPAQSIVRQAKLLTLHRM